ncbi:formate dehydrogenase [Variovorax sp.]|uniref:formate dehydrogenase n=1 Tax=Variovorax sp. TaxID=1871043 RepID=UPI002D6886E3|nr:formate dehydrogenase [Variovorax sp.]HYP84929.1 formate dehydrogenase [Variovorax sp.]
MQDSQKTPEDKTHSRRRFFAGAAGLGAAATAVAVLPGAAVDAAGPIPEAAPVPPEKGGGYRVSEHVKRYYRSTSA